MEQNIPTLLPKEMEFYVCDFLARIHGAECSFQMSYVSRPGDQAMKGKEKAEKQRFCQDPS